MDDARVIGGRHLFHLGGQGHFPISVSGVDTVQLLPGMSREQQPGQSPQQQADAIAPAVFAKEQPEQRGHKKCRKRQQKPRLRQKRAHQLYPQRTNAEDAERPTHIRSVEEQRQRLKVDDILALRCIALSQDSRLAHDGALGLLCQSIQCLEGATRGDDVVHD